MAGLTLEECRRHRQLQGPHIGQQAPTSSSRSRATSARGVLEDRPESGAYIHPFRRLLHKLLQDRAVALLSKRGFTILLRMTARFFSPAAAHVTAIAERHALRDSAASVDCLRSPGGGRGCSMTPTPIAPAEDSRRDLALGFQEDPRRKSAVEQGACRHPSATARLVLSARRRDAAPLI